MRGADLPLNEMRPFAASSEAPYLHIQSQPRMTLSMRPLITLQVMDIGMSWSVNFSRTSPMDGTSEPLMAVPHDSRGVKKRLRYGVFTKYSYEIQDNVQPESQRTGLR